MATPSKSVYQFNITLNYSNPPIWRQFMVPDCTLYEFHLVIQRVMGWMNCHLHQFRVGEELYGPPDMLDVFEDDDRLKDSTQYTLGDIFTSPEEHPPVFYEYDFGDGWMHTIVCEEITDRSDVKKPVCLAGERACPPEDCGGIDGFYYLLEVLNDPSHSEYEELKEWCGDFDPDRFSPQALF